MKRKFDEIDGPTSSKMAMSSYVAFSLTVTVVLCCASPYVQLSSGGQMQVRVCVCAQWNLSTRPKHQSSLKPHIMIIERDLHAFKTSTPCSVNIWDGCCLPGTFCTVELRESQRYLSQNPYATLMLCLS